MAFFGANHVSSVQFRLQVHELRALSVELFDSMGKSLVVHSQSGKLFDHAFAALDDR